MLLPHRLGPLLSKLGHPLASLGRNPPALNLPLPPSQLGLLDLKVLIPRERGAPRARTLWTRENPNLLRRRMRPRARNN